MTHHYRYVSHPCPRCSRTVTQPLDPGRRRVYCSNACRQAAYRNRISRRKTGYGSGAWKRTRDWYYQWKTGPGASAYIRSEETPRARALRLIAQMTRLMNDPAAYAGEVDSAHRRIEELKRKYGL